MSYRMITISGEVGSGKSTLAKVLLKQLPGWQHENTGRRFRQFCQARGWPIEKVSEVPDEVHREFDDHQRSLLEEGHQLIVEGRLSGWLGRDLEDVFRVFCVAPLDVRLARFIERENVTRQQAEAKLIHRDEQDIQKFRQMYRVADYRDANFYHLRLDTSTADPDELACQILVAAGLATSPAIPPHRP